MFDQIVQESGFTKELLRRGEQEGRLQARRDDLLAIVTDRFPLLQQGTEEYIGKISDVAQLRNLFIQLANAPDEATARTALGLPQP